MNGLLKALNVSGEVIFLRDSPDGNVASLVRAASAVAEHAGVPIAVIGGLAVACRLATAHRATADVDVVADDPSAVVAASRTAGDNLIATGLGVRAPDTTSVRIYMDGTKVEIIDTQAIDDSEAAEVDPDPARLFVLSHRWALESATTCTIAVADSNVEVTVRVAIPAALVAMKLHAIQTRSEDRKRASDAWDLYRLLSLDNASDALARAFVDAPFGLVPLVIDGLDLVFRRDVTRTRHWLRGFGEPAWAVVMTEQAMADLASDFVESLKP